MADATNQDDATRYARYMASSTGKWHIIGWVVRGIVYTRCSLFGDTQEIQVRDEMPEGGVICMACDSVPVELPELRGGKTGWSAYSPNAGGRISRLLGDKVENIYPTRQALLSYATKQDIQRHDRQHR
jgi:hypothetical protein